MRLRSFLLADAVVVQPDGKAIIFGAGIGQILAQVLPWSQPQLAAFITLDLDEEDLGATHTFTVELLDPEQAAVVNGRITGSFSVPTEAADAGSPSVNFAPVFGAAQFTQTGHHYIRLAFDDRDLARFPLEVTLQPSQEPTTWSVIHPGGASVPPGEPN